MNVSTSPSPYRSPRIVAPQPKRLTSHETTPLLLSEADHYAEDVHAWPSASRLGRRLSHAGLTLALGFSPPDLENGPTPPPRSATALSDGSFVDVKQKLQSGLMGMLVGCLTGGGLAGMIAGVGDDFPKVPPAYGQMGIILTRNIVEPGSPAATPVAVIWGVALGGVAGFALGVLGYRPGQEGQA